MTPQERENMLTEARTFYLAAPLILPLIERRKKYAMDRLMAKHRDGATDFLTLVSELAVLSDLEREITSKEQTYKLMEDQSGSTRR